MRHRLRQLPRGQRGPLTGPNPTDRGKSGSKIHLIVDRHGLPLSLGISGEQRARQPGLRTARPRHTAYPIPTRTPQAAPGETPRRQGIRLTSPATMGACTRDHTTHRPPGSRELPPARPAQVGRRTHHRLAQRMPSTAPALRTQGRPLPGFHRDRGHTHLLPPTPQMKWPVTT